MNTTELVTNMKRDLASLKNGEIKYVEDTEDFPSLDGRMMTPISSVYLARHLSDGEYFACFKFKASALAEELVLFCKGVDEKTFDFKIFSVDGAPKHFTLLHEVSPSVFYDVFSTYNKLKLKNPGALLISFDFMDAIEKLKDANA